MKIQLLPPEVVNQIAAGEVLERPANLVKELVENSLDAGAETIQVEFAQGGREVVIVDDGRGMGREDLELCVQRHATSKIQSSEDLYRLHSFGFRGEALASVAAVSRLQITSRERGADTGYRLSYEWGQMGVPLPVASVPGTEVRVRELFGNVPARLRFMKSDSAEHTQIKTTLKALALANPQVTFFVRSQGELLHHWPKAQSLLERGQQVLGMKTLHSGTSEEGEFKVEVLASSPQESAPVNRNMWFFVQGRWVQDRTLIAAVMEGYRNLLMHGQYPSVVVKIALPPEEVDVNVHPTKAQVKFRDSQAVFRATQRALRKVLEPAPWLNGSFAAKPGDFATRSGDSSRPMSDSRDSEAAFNFRFQAPELERTQYPNKVFPVQEIREVVTSYRSQVEAEVATANGTSGAIGTIETTEATGTTAPGPLANRPASFQEHWASLHVVGQLKQTYIIAQSEEAFYLVDQHAAHERVVFERLLASFEAGHMDIQNLLIPLVVDLPAPEVEALVKSREQLAKVGLSVEAMGPESLAVQSLPSLVNEHAVTEALRKLGSEMLEIADESAVQRVIRDILATMACHSVVRAGQTLSHEQMVSLLRQMDEFPLSSFCPHGRPVYVKRRFYEIEREFGRIV